MAEVLKAVAQMSLFAHLNTEVLMAILSRSILSRYASYTVLFKEQEKAACLWIVVSGRVKVVKAVRIKDADVLVGIADVKELSVVGESHYFSREPYHTGCVVDTPSEILAIPFEVIDKYFDLLSKDLLKQACRELPSVEDIRRMYIQTLQWERFKKDLFQEKLFQSRQMKRERQELRVPLPKMNYLPKDIVKFITEEPKHLFFKKKTKPSASKEPLQHLATQTTLEDPDFDDLKQEIKIEIAGPENSRLDSKTDLGAQEPRNTVLQTRQSDRTLSRKQTRSLKPGLSRLFENLQDSSAEQGSTGRHADSGFARFKSLPKRQRTRSISIGYSSSSQTID